jgi:hypothetical protein
MQAATVVTMQPPGPVTIAPYARSIQLHFRWTAILAAVLHVGLLVLFAGKGVTSLAVQVVGIAYFLLFLNLLVLARVGWRLFSARTRTTAGLLLLASLASLLLWMLADVRERMPAAVAYAAAALAAVAWLGVLVLLQGVVANADGIVEDAFQRSSPAAQAVRAFVPAPQPDAAAQALGQVGQATAAGIGQFATSAPVVLPALPPAPTMAAPQAPTPTMAAPQAPAPVVTPALPPAPVVAAAQAQSPTMAVPAAVRGFWRDWFSGKGVSGPAAPAAAAVPSALPSAR